MNGFHDIQEILGAHSPIEMAQIILGMEVKIIELESTVRELRDRMYDDYLEGCEAALRDED